jgi:regulatory protein
MRNRRQRKFKERREGEEEARPRKVSDPERARTRTLQRAVKLLAAKPRSVEELRARLLEKEWTDEAAADYALSKLKEYGYLDDERFAFGFASYRVKQKPLGRQRLARDLKTRKVSKEAADAALELVYQETTEEELITRAIEKRVRLRGRPTTRQETKSLYEHLLRLGFPYDLIIRKVREASSAAPEDEDDAAAD